MFEYKRLALVLLFLAFPVFGFTQTPAVEDKPKEEVREFPYTYEIGVFSGFACGKLEEKQYYRVIPQMLRWGFNLNTVGLGFTDLLKPLTDKLNVKPKGFTELVFEPFVNIVATPDSNIEAGCTILMKYAYPVTEKLYPYGIAGGGIIYLTQHTREQSTQYNFTPQMGAGITYFFKKDLAFNIEYRYRHLSNGGIKEPNGGINVGMLLLGVSLFY